MNHDKCINPECGYEPNGRGWLLSNPVQCPNCHTPQVDTPTEEPTEEITSTPPSTPLSEASGTHYVDSRTPEERANEPETTMTTATDMTQHPEKEPCEWEKDFRHLEVTYKQLGARAEFSEPLLLDTEVETIIIKFIRQLLASARQEAQRNCDEITALARREERERIIKKIKNKLPTLKKQLDEYTVLPFYREAGEIRGEITMAEDILEFLADLSDNIK